MSLRLTPRRIAIIGGLAILTVGMLLTLGGGREALLAILSARTEWILLACIIHYSGFAVRGWRWQRLLRLMGHSLTWRFSTALLLSGWFVSALLPARAGDLLRIGVLRLTDETHPTIPIADSLGSIVLERTADLTALILLGAGAGALMLQAELPLWILWAYGVACTALFVVAGVAVFMPRFLGRLLSLWQQPLWHRLIHFVLEILQSLRALGRQPFVALLILVQSLYIWLCDAFLMWLVLKALGVTINLGAITFVALSVDILAAIPFTPGGVGQIEAVNVALLALLPLTASQIAASVLLNRAISYWSFLPFSGIVTFAAGIGQLIPKLPQNLDPPEH